MKATGIIREVDTLGRIVIPIELKKILNIQLGEYLSFDIKEDYITVNKVSANPNLKKTNCTVCNEFDKVTIFKDSYICSNCIQAIAKI